MLLGFKAQNHPQQLGVRGALDEVDDRATHPDDFARWDAEFGPFTLDAAAAQHNAKCKTYYTRAIEGQLIRHATDARAERTNPNRLPTKPGLMR